MRSLCDIRARTPKSQIFVGQVQHLMIATLLTVGAFSLFSQPLFPQANQQVSLFFWLGIVVALFHQSLVAVVFRLQLHLNLMVRMFGKHALTIWGVMFLPLLIARPTFVLLTGIYDTSPMLAYAPLYLVGGVLLMIPAIWGMHSVLKYFTIARALGGDHFYDRYANMPLVNKGIFKYSSNAMYSFIFLGFWGIALLTNSWNALVLALFNHAYIWVHMYCTERPDMEVIYGEK